MARTRKLSKDERIAQLILERSRLEPFEAYFTCISMGELPITLTVNEGPERRQCKLIGMRRAHGGLVVLCNIDLRPIHVEYIETWLTRSRPKALETHTLESRLFLALYNAVCERMRAWHDNER